MVYMCNIFAHVGVGVWVRAHVEDKGACQMSYSVTLHLYSLQTGFLTEAGARLAVSKPSVHSISVQCCAQLCPVFLYGCWSFELSPHACTVSTRI